MLAGQIPLFICKNSSNSWKNKLVSGDQIPGLGQFLVGRQPEITVVYLIPTANGKSTERLTCG